MPKKFQGVNTKAAEAKARKAATVNAAAQLKQKEAEDEYWRDDDKHVNKKQQRKQAQESKRLNSLNKKKELEELYKAEEESLKKATKSATSSKVTRSDIESARRKEQEAKEAQAHIEKLKKKNISVQNDDIEENINVVVAESSVKGDVSARTVEEAISALGVQDELDRHPERRLKASFAKYEQERMPAMKAANPNMRLSQLRQILRKDWQKSPENPMNQKHKEYNSK